MIMQGAVGRRVRQVIDDGAGDNCLLGLEEIFLGTELMNLRPGLFI